MASSSVTKEIESRLKQTPGHVFEVFLEIHAPIGREPPAILIQYPSDFSDEILKTAGNFAYPSPIPSDEQSEHFTFVILDATGSTFRFGYCRRSNRESTCLCLISYFPWFETFYTILNDLSQIINTKPYSEVEVFLSSLYNYKLMPLEQFYRNEGQETIDVHCPTADYHYTRPDQRKLPSMLSNRNFSVMFSRLGPDIMLRLFGHLLFERRILFVSSKLFHLTACAWGCVHLIYPMHWQSIFLPILPESLSWTSQCTAPYIIGVHSSVYSKINRKELGDVIIVNIDERTLESPYDDLGLFPKDLIRSIKKGIQQSSQLVGDHLARVFLRAMAFIIGNYANGFTIKNDKLDYDREMFLQQYLQSSLHAFMSSVANTQLFEQFSRHRSYLQLQREMDVDEFDIEVKNFERFQQSRRLKTNKKLLRMLEKTTNPLIEQVDERPEQLPTMMNRLDLRTTHELSNSTRNNFASIDGDPNRLIVHQLITPQVPAERSNQSSRSSSPELLPVPVDRLIDLNFEENYPLPSPVVLDVIQRSSPSPVTRATPQIDSKIKQLQTELQYRVQTFDGPRIDPRHEYGEQQKEIKKLVQQFDPFDTDQYLPSTNQPEITNSAPVDADEVLSPIERSHRHPSLLETIPTNHVHQMLQNIQSNYGTNIRSTTASLYPRLPATTAPDPNTSDLIDLN